MKFVTASLLTLLICHVGSKATSNSESKSDSSSSSSSSEEANDKHKSKSNETNPVGTLEEEGSLAKFDKAMEKDGVSQGYEDKNEQMKNATNTVNDLTSSPEFKVLSEDKKREALDKITANLNASDSKENDKIADNGTLTIESNGDIESAEKNETALGIDTFGAQGI